MSSMSFAQSYVLASKVRSKLSKDASNPKVSLRSLVTQANMLDNLMDHIADENNKRLENLNKVKFELPRRTQQHNSIDRTSITEYEVSDDSDEDYESDDYESDSDDYYYSSEEEEDEEPVRVDEALQVKVSVQPIKLAAITEESEIPELSRSDESEDSDDDYFEVFTSSTNLMNHSLFHKPEHQRHDAIYSINEVY